MSEKQSKAVETFNSGCNCAQSVLTSFSDKLEMNREQLMAVSAGFGAGMGRLQETCGAATMIRKFTKRFIEIEGTTNCRALIDCDLNTEEGQQHAHEEGVFEKVCAKCVSTAVGIVEEMIDG